MSNKMDKYDKAVKYLTEHPKEIEICWDKALCDDDDFMDGSVEKEAHEIASCLFKNCGVGPSTGCLTQVRSCDSTVASTPKMTRAIKADERIPEDGADIKVKDLPVFAEWRRRIDKDAKAVKAAKTRATRAAKAIH